jgi:diguanylate cyclase (GGDEF)-like protein
MLLMGCVPGVDETYMAFGSDSVRLNSRLMALSAAAMYGATGGIDVLERFIPGSARFALLPGVVALAVALALAVIAPRTTRWGLAPIVPIAIGLIAWALSTAPNASDAAVIYMCPVLWTVAFFGLPGVVASVAGIAVAYGAVLLSTTPTGYVDQWIDVTAAVSVIAAFGCVMARRNDALVVRLAGEARADKLTGLLNRRGFEERAEIAMAHARRVGSSIAVVAFDIDYFKRVNDEWGHATGDRVLARIGALLTQETRQVDVVARIGGEEFVVLLHATDTAEADAFTHRCQLAMAADDGSNLPLMTLSAGIAAAVAPQGLEPLLGAADSALYAAKQGGRDRAVVAEHPDAAHRAEQLSP